VTVSSLLSGLDRRKEAGPQQLSVLLSPQSTQATADTSNTQHTRQLGQNERPTILSCAASSFSASMLFISYNHNLFNHRNFLFPPYLSFLLFLPPPYPISCPLNEQMNKMNNSSLSHLPHAVIKSRPPTVRFKLNIHSHLTGICVCGSIRPRPGQGPATRISEHNTINAMIYTLTMTSWHRRIRSMGSMVVEVLLVCLKM